MFRTREESSTKQAGNAFIGIWLGVSIFVALMDNHVGVSRVYMMFYPLIIISGIGLYFILDRIKLMSVAGIIIVSFCLVFILFSKTYFDKKTTVRFFPGFGECVQYAEQSGRDILCLRGYNRSEIEILTMFYAGIDAEYYQGIRDAYDKNGNKLLPYKERYIFVNIEDDFMELQQDNAVYIFPAEEKHLFDPSNYQIIIFDSFGTALLK